MSSGIDAMMGIGSLCRHRMSNTSSKNPSMVAIRRDSRDERYTANWKPIGLSSGQMEDNTSATHLMVRKLVDDKAFASSPCRVIVGSEGFRE